MNRHIISIAGDIASGKGAVTKVLKDKLNYEVYRNGEYFRKLAAEHNMSVKDFNIYVENHKEIDYDIENSAKKYAEEHDNLIIDARLGWYAVPHSFKVYLTVDLDEAARRVFNDSTRGEVEKYLNIEDAKKQIKERFDLENSRYLKLYNVVKNDMNNYDYILDTTNISPEEVAEKIYNEYTKWLNNTK